MTNKSGVCRGIHILAFGALMSILAASGAMTRADDHNFTGYDGDFEHVIVSRVKAFKSFPVSSLAVSNGNSVKLEPNFLFQKTFAKFVYDIPENTSWGEYVSKVNAIINSEKYSRNEQIVTVDGVSFSPKFVNQIIVNDLAEKGFSFHCNNCKMEEISQIPLDSEVAKDFSAAYKQLDNIWDAPIDQKMSIVKFANRSLSNHKQLYSRVSTSLGSITFGIPAVGRLCKDDMEEPIYSFWRKDYELRVLKFGISIVDLDVPISELNIFVNLPESSVAVNLIPFKMISREKIESLTQKMKMPCTLEGDDYFLEGLNPEMVAFGVQNSQFGWRFSGVTVEEGAFWVAVVAALPKNLDTALVSIEYIGRTSEATIWAQGNSIYGDPESMEVRY